MNSEDIASADQVNLIGFKNFIKSLLRGFFMLLTFIGHVLKRQIKVILICLVLGMLLGAVYHFLEPKQFRASMIVVSNVLPKKTYGQIISQLNLMAHSGTPGILSDELGLPKTFQNDLKNIDSKTISDEALVTDTSTRLGQPFQIIVGLGKMEGSDTVQAAILNYINSLPYLKKLAEVEKASNQQKLVTIQRDLENLDTLKTEFNHYFASSKISATINNVVINPADIYAQSHMLVDDRNRTTRALFVENTPLTLVAGLKGNKATHLLSGKELVILIGAGGFLLGFLFGLLIELRKLVI